MADLNKQALEMWNSMKPMIDREIDQQTKGTVQRRKAKVTTAPSIATKKIGVTEPFGDQYFVPYDERVSGAKVGDTVWVEFMYGATNAFVSMFASAVEPTLNCSAELSSIGWYRVLTITGTDDEILGIDGFIIDMDIMRSSVGSAGEVHSIKLSTSYNQFVFYDEASNARSLGITKVRWSSSSAGGHIDVYYAKTTSDTVAADFTIHILESQKRLFKTEPFQLVADAPSGETTKATYNFHSDYDQTSIVDVKSLFTLTNSLTRGTASVSSAHRCGNVVSMTLVVNCTATVNEGYDIWNGSFTGPAPVDGNIAVSYNFNQIWACRMKSDGGLIIRNVKGTGANGDQQTFCFTYLTNA